VNLGDGLRLREAVWPLPDDHGQVCELLDLTAAWRGEIILDDPLIEP
jgi:hypothetical protein